jgi:glutathione S-transferase
MATMALQFWAAPVCPYAQRGWIALKETGAKHEYKAVDLHNKSPEFVELYRKVVQDPEANAKVPVLVDGELEITESPVVAEYILNKYGPSTGILPSEPAQLAKARLWADLWGSYVGPAQTAILQADTKAKVAEATDKMAAALKVMDAFLRSQGSTEGGAYFLGGRYSIAEVLTTSLLQRAIVYPKAYRGVDLRQLVKDNKLERFEAWMEAALARPSAQETHPDEAKLVEHGTKFTKPMQD